MRRENARLWILFTFLAALTIGTPALAQTNLLVNPGFEASGGSYDGWFTFGSGVQLSLPDGDDIIRTGYAASKVYGGFVGCPDSPQFNVGGFGQAFTPTVGLVYEATGFSFVSVADPIPGTDTCNANRMLAKVVFFNAPVGGAEIASNEIVIGDGNSVTNQWVPFTVSAPAPAGAQRVELLFLYLQPACDTGAVYIDDTFFRERTVAAESNLLVNSSFSSGLSGWTAFGNVYAENRSAYVRTPSGSAKLYGTFVEGSDSGLYQAFSASEGTAWQLDAYSLTTCLEDPINESNENYAIVKIVFRNSSNLELGAAEAVIVDNQSPLGTWTRHSLLANGAPPGTVVVEAYVLFVSPLLEGGAMWIDDLAFRELVPASAPEDQAQLSFELGQNVPNPFTNSTRVDLMLREAETVDVSVYDIAGRSVAQLVRGSLGPGLHSFTWDGRSSDGTFLPAGVYQYVLRTPSGQTSRSMMLAR